MVLCLAEARGHAAVNGPPLALVPWPHSITNAAGSVDLGPGCRIVVQAPELEPLAKVLAGEIYLSTAVKVPVGVGEAGEGCIALRLSDSVAADEGYRLMAGPGAL